MITIVATFFLVIMLVVGISASVQYKATVPLHGRRVELSKTSRRIVKEFKRIPDASKPYPVESLYAALHALDVAHPEVDRHFRWMDPYDGGSSFSWYGGDAGHRNCEHQEYYSLHLEIDKLISSIQEREQALAVAGVQANLDRVKELTDAIRQETKIVKQVTKELI